MKYINRFDTTSEYEAYIQSAEAGNYVSKVEDFTDEYKIAFDKVEQPTPPHVWTGLTFTAVEPNSTVKFNVYGIYGGEQDEWTAEYSTDGINWTDAVQVTVTLSNVGDKVYYRGIQSAEPVLTAMEAPRFIMTGKIAASGSVMSLINNTPEDNTITYPNAFRELFHDCLSLVAAPEFPATTLTRNAYAQAFYGCENLVEGPEIMATEMSNYCFSYMFRNCYNLSSVKIHITDWNTSNASSWLHNVADNGTLYCPSNCTIPNDSEEGIPTGWTRVNF